MPADLAPPGARSRPERFTSRLFGRSLARSPLVWLGLAVSVGFAYLAVRDVRLADTWAALRASNYWWLVPATATLAFGVALRAIRWRAVFDPASRPPLGPTAQALLVGYLFNNILPLRAGEAVRVVGRRS